MTLTGTLALQIGTSVLPRRVTELLMPVQTMGISKCLEMVLVAEWFQGAKFYQDGQQLAHAALVCMTLGCYQ